MASAVSCFFTLELGRNNKDQLNRYFRISIVIYIVISLIVLILSETLGIWFLENKLIIPLDRMSAATWVYQISILSFIATLMTIPYSSIIIAHERMDVYAYIGIAEVLMKFIIAYILPTISFDKLKVYSTLYLVTILLILALNYTFCRCNYKESKFTWYWSDSMFKEMVSYSIWSLFGAISGVARNQGMNILLSMYFNPAINAARAIAFQVSDGINQFSNSFFMAISPQITKNFAANEYDDMIKLVYRSTRFSFYILYIIALPIIIETQYILNLWLVQPPLYSVSFARLVILTSLIDSLGYPLMTAINAKGVVKYYQMATGGVLILTLPISYLFLEMGYRPESTMYVALATSVAAQISRIIFMKSLHGLSIKKYLEEVIAVIACVVICSALMPLLSAWLPNGWSQ